VEASGPEHDLSNASEQSIVRWDTRSGVVFRPDDLAPEEPLEIRVDNHPVSVTMRTPGNDEELAAGFLVSEGLIQCRAQIEKIRPHPRNRNNIINVFLSRETEFDPARLTRHVFASSSCGLCGKASIESIHQQFPPISKAIQASSAVVLRLPEKLRLAQRIFDRTGGLHAAGLFNLGGAPILVREDIGRHNAVDKIIGRALLDGLLPLEEHILVVSGRASFEIVQKALAARIPVVAAVSAASDLAVEFARTSRQVLIGFLRADRMNVYACPERVQFQQPYSADAR
jgi:FdhD protein